MLRDCYCIPEDESRYDINALEIQDELTEILLQIDLLLFTDEGEVFGLPTFGCNLETILFSTTYNEQYIANTIDDKIKAYVYMDGRYKVSTNVEFVQWKNNVAMILDIKVSDSQSGISRNIKYRI